MRVNPFDRADKLGLLVNLSAALIAVLAANGLIALFNPIEISMHRSSALTPPGIVIGLVWTTLFLCMAIARWRLLRDPGKPLVTDKPILLLALSCLLYPLYTGGLRSETVGLVGNVVLLVFSLWVVRHSALRSKTAAAWVAPVAIWLSYAMVASFFQVWG